MATTGKLLIAIFMAFVFIRLSAQDYITVQGVVVDKRSTARLPYANISIVGRSLGSVSNSDGAFEFHIPSMLAADSLSISYIGYKTLKLGIGWLRRNNTTYFALEEDVVVLGEVVVTADMAKTKVERALNAVSKNFSTQPYLMEAFYRSWEMVSFTDSITYPGTLIEAALVIYDPGYKNGNKITEKTYVKDVRRSKLMAGWNYNTGAVVGEKLFRENQVKYHAFAAESFLANFFDLSKTLQYTLEDVVRYNGEDVDVITVRIPNSRDFPAVYRVYISQTDNAVLKFTLTGKKDIMDYRQPYEFSDIEHVYLFKRYNNNCYLSYAKVQYKLTKVDTRSRRTLQVETYYNEMLISDIVTENVEALQKNYLRTLSKKSPIFNPEKYNAEFWNNYNVVLENPIDKAVLEAFETNEPLRKQYENAELENRKSIKKNSRKN